MSNVTIVTGGSRGIGAATAIACAEAGHKVAVNYIAHSNAADRVVDHIKSAGGEAVAFKADTAIEAEAIGMFKAVETSLKKAEYFVNVSYDALAIFPDNEDKKILQNLTSFSLNRSF